MATLEHEGGLQVLSTAREALERKEGRGHWLVRSLAFCMVVAVCVGMVWWLQTSRTREQRTVQAGKISPAPATAQKSRPPAQESASPADRELRTQVERDIATHPELRRLGLAVEIVKVENGYVTFGLLNGPAGLALELTGASWLTEAIPGFANEFVPKDLNSHIHANGVVIMMPSPEDRERCKRVCASLAAAIGRNKTCKGVFWTEVPAARARRLMVEAGTVFFSNGTPFGKALREAYWNWRTEDWDRVVFPPGINRFLAAKIGGKEDLRAALRPVWGKTEHAQFWVTLFQLDEGDQDPWFRAYRDAWRTPDLWKQLGASEAEAAEGIMLWDELETAMRSGHFEEVTLDDLFEDDQSQEELDDPFAGDVWVSASLPMVSLALAVEAMKAEHADTAVRTNVQIAVDLEDLENAMRSGKEMVVFATRRPFYAPGDRVFRKERLEENAPSVACGLWLWKECEPPGPIQGWLFLDRMLHPAENEKDRYEVCAVVGAQDTERGNYTLTRDDARPYRGPQERIKKVEVRQLAGKHYQVTITRGKDTIVLEVERIVFKVERQLLEVERQ